MGSMNPHTLLRLGEAFDGRDPLDPVRIQDIMYAATTWPGTVYRAEMFGYLKRVAPAWFVATDVLRDEVRFHRSNKKRVSMEWYAPPSSALNGAHGERR